jgi:hypothetical protein
MPAYADTDVRPAGAGRESIGARSWNCSGRVGTGVAEVTVMRTTSGSVKAMAMLGAGLVAASSLTGCLPLGGCGVPDDPRDVATFAVTAKSSITNGAQVDGIAQTSTGVWILTNPAGSHGKLTEYDRIGGTQIAERVVPAVVSETSFVAGLTADGDALWYGDHHNASGVDRAWRFDATRDELRAITLPGQESDLAWNGTSLVAVERLASIDWLDPADGKLAASVPLRRLAWASAVAYHDGETWVAMPGQPVLVYDADLTLLATVNVDAVTGASDALHMTFVGDDLVVSSGTQLTTYAIDRAVPTVTP